MKIRMYTKADTPKLVRLLNKTQRNEYEFIPYTEPKFLTEVREGNATVLVAEEDEIEGFAMLHRGEHGEELRWLCVKAQERQREIEDELVFCVEKQVRSERLFTVIDSRHDSRIANFTRRGYEVYGGLYQMIAKLTSPYLVPYIGRRSFQKFSSK